MSDGLKVEDLLRRHRLHCGEHVPPRIPRLVEAKPQHLVGTRTNASGEPTEDRLLLCVYRADVAGRTSKKKGATVAQSTAAASR